MLITANNFIKGLAPMETEKPKLKRLS